MNGQKGMAWDGVFEKTGAQSLHPLFLFLLMFSHLFQFGELPNTWVGPGVTKTMRCDSAPQGSHSLVGEPDAQANNYSASVMI